MPDHNRNIFVLIGDHFNELAATTVIIILRKAGLRVKVVGLTPQTIIGMYGLALVPDMMLEQALPLVANVSCLVIPYPLQRIQHLVTDPRLSQFFRQASANKAKFVIGHRNETDNRTYLESLPELEDIIHYSDSENLVLFAQELARLLSNETV